MSVSPDEMIDLDASPTTLNQAGEEALLGAAHFGHLGMVERIMEHGGMLLNSSVGLAVGPKPLAFVPINVNGTLL